MGIFNPTINEPSIKNKEGAPAYKLDPYTDLYLKVASSLYGQSKFYESSSTATKNLENSFDAMLSKDAEFALDLAAYSRNELNMRSTPIWMLCRAAHALRGGESVSVRKYVPYVVRRADEIQEAIACYYGYSHSLPNALKRGLRDTFDYFTPYQLSKYNRTDAEVKIRDSLCLLHPTPSTLEMSEVFKAILENKISNMDTWESIISNNGSTKEAWEQAAEVMPIFATVRNLRNFIQHDISNVDVVCERLTNPEILKRSGILPFRFYSAYNSIKHYGMSSNGRKLLDALNKSITISTDLIPKMKGSTLIIVDRSGSMRKPMSSFGTATCEDISMMMGAIAGRVFSDSVVAAFATDVDIVNLFESDSVFTNIEKIRHAHVGPGNTYLYKVFNKIIAEGVKFDRILLFSDMQCYSNLDAETAKVAPLYAKYRNEISPSCLLYSVDLSGYSEAAFPEFAQGVIHIGGWSDNVFTFMRAVENFNVSGISSFLEQTPLIKAIRKESVTEVKRESKTSKKSQKSNNKKKVVVNRQQNKRKYYD